MTLISGTILLGSKGSVKNTNKETMNKNHIANMGETIQRGACEIKWNENKELKANWTFLRWLNKKVSLSLILYKH